MQRRHRTLHRRIWLGLVILLPLTLLAAVGFRQNGPIEARAILLKPPP